MDLPGGLGFIIAAVVYILKLAYARILLNANPASAKLLSQLPPCESCLMEHLTNALAPTSRVLSPHERIDDAIYSDYNSTYLLGSPPCSSCCFLFVQDVWNLYPSLKNEGIKSDPI